jgi:hypothetical protein
MQTHRIFLLFLLVSSASLAQPIRSSRIVAGFDIGMAFEQKNLAPSLQGYQLLKVDKKGIVQLGYGVRLNRFMSKDLNLISNQNDTLQMRQTAVTVLNFGLKAQLSFKIVEIGASIDLLGLGFGGQRTGFYVSRRAFSATDSLNLHRTEQEAKPRTGNLQLFSSNSIGNLNADVYARIWLGRNVGLKAGYLFNFTQYRTNRELLNANRDFSIEPRLIYVGVAIPIAN